jgi:cytoskeleton protein RodZ
MGSFGERLQREREMRGITLEEIADSTKIGTRSLRALEQEDFDKLPGGIFNKGFVRAYARYLGIDEEQAVADFLAAAGEPEQPLPSPAPRERLPASSGGWSWAAVLALVALAAGGYAAWKLNLGPFAKPAVQQSSPPPVQSTPVAAVPLQASPSEAGGAAGAAGTKPAEDLSTSASPAAADSSEKPASGTTPGEGFVVLVRAKQDSWLSISADGRVVMEGMLATAETREVRATRNITLKLGNAAGVEVSYNSTVMPPLGRANEVKTVVFTPQGLQP